MDFNQQPSGDGSLGIDLEIGVCDYEALYCDGVIHLELTSGVAQALANFHYYIISQPSMPAVFDENFPILEFDGYIPDEGE